MLVVEVVVVPAVGVEVAFVPVVVGFVGAEMLLLQAVDLIAAPPSLRQPILQVGSR